jgi:hypothetical protein
MGLWLWPNNRRPGNLTTFSRARQRSEGPTPERIMIAATHKKIVSLGEPLKKVVWRPCWMRTAGGHNRLSNKRRIISTLCKYKVIY